MPRSRSNGGEVGFGSDSFLDIIANIVGILIILIVVAGVKVSQAPLLDVEPEPVPNDAPVPTVALSRSLMPAAEKPSDDEFVASPTTARFETPVVAARPRRVVEPPAPTVPTPPPEPEPVPEPSPALQRDIRELRLALVSLDDAFEADRAAYRSLAERTEETRRNLARAEADLAEQRRRVSATAGDVKRLESDLRKSADLVVELRKRLEDEEERRPNVERLQHRMTAMGRVVEGRELHFRLSGNRVAPIPLEDLLGLLKDQIERQKDWLVKFRAHQGLVGPIDGFELEYVVQREAESALDRLQGRPGMVRIGVSRWEVKPTAEARGETYEQAMQPGSRFRRALGRSEATTTLTFWTYPDSYEVYRQLQAVAHENDFTVAGRPLPAGVPIAGSPGGSRSSGQ